MSLVETLSAYLTRTSEEPTEVVAFARISGGASRETYRFDAVRGGERTGYILRRDPPGSLIETDRRLEFAAIRSFTGKGVAAPEAMALEIDGAELERPFFIMKRVEGGAAGSPFASDPFGAHAGTMAEQFFGHLGKIAREPIEGLPISEVCEAPAEPWRAALDYWAGVIEDDEQHPQPIVRAAIRRLYRRPPPPPRKLAVVHGDYRMGNFLHDGAGALLAVLDWEMAHIGDPLEDLGWATNPLWSRPDDPRISGMAPMDEALAIWSRASGLDVDLESFRWWSLFASVKGQAIWTSAAKEWRDGGMVEPILCFSGWYTQRRQDQILSAQLAEFPL